MRLGFGVGTRKEFSLPPPRLSLPSARSLAEDAFDDQCTGANPRYPLMADLKQLYLDAHAAPILPVKTLEFFSKIN